MIKVLNTLLVLALVGYAVVGWIAVYHYWNNAEKIIGAFGFAMLFSMAAFVVIWLWWEFRKT